MNIQFMILIIILGMLIGVLVCGFIWYYTMFLEDKIYEWRRKRLIKKLEEMPTWDEVCIKLLGLSKKEEKDGD